MTKLNRSIRRWGHVSCQLGPSLSGVTFSDQKGNWFLAPHERQRPAHNRALKFTKNTWLPPLCSHLLASPCQSGSQPQPKEMSSRIDKEPRTRISKYLFFVTCQSTFMIGTLKSEAILMSPLPLVGFNSQYSVFMINLLKQEMKFSGKCHEFTWKPFQSFQSLQSGWNPPSLFFQGQSSSRSS